MWAFDSLVASITTFLIPIGIGQLIVYLVKLFMKQHNMELSEPHGHAHEKVKLTDSFSTLLGRDFSLGALTIYTMLVIINLISKQYEFSYVFGIFSYTTITLGLGYILARLLLKLGKKAHAYVTTTNFNSETIIDTITAKVWALGLCIILATLSQLVWKWKSGLSNSLDWDTFFHQMIINNIIDGKFSVMLSRISDSVIVNAYSSIFHVILAIPQRVFNPDIIAFWWYAGYVQLVLITITSYNVGSAIYKYIMVNEYTNAVHHKLYTNISYIIGTITAMLSAFSFLSYLAYSPYFLIPQILAATIAANGLIVLLYQLKYKHAWRSTVVNLIPILVFVTLNHYVLGTYCAVLIMGIALAHAITSKFPKLNLSSTFRYLSLLLLVLIPFVLRYFNLEDLNPNESSYYTIDLKEKFDQLVLFYGYLWVVLLPLGLIFLLKKSNEPANILFSLFIIIIATIIAPIPYNLKFLSFGSFIVHAFMALGFYMILNLFNTEELPDKLNIYQYILICTLGIAVFYNLINNVISYKQTPTFKDRYSHVSTSEINASKYLRQKYALDDKNRTVNTLLVSDPATMFILEALANINTPGGAYTNIDTRKTLTDIYYTRDTALIKESLLSIKDRLTNSPDRVLFVISHRYFEWINGNDEQINAYYHNIWQPIDLKVGDYDYLEFLRGNARFVPVYADEGIMVFEISR